MCYYLKISRNAYYHWLKDTGRKPSSHKLYLKSEIQRIYDFSTQTYGSYKIAKSMQSEGIKISRSYVALLMREMGVRSILSKKFVVTTDSKHTHPVAENKLNRAFKVDELGKVWVSDITYIRVNNEWVYLTTMIDLADRKVVGWSLSKDMTAENTVTKAWIKATSRRAIVDGFILHSDRGVQYACNQFRNIFPFHLKASQSMSRKGNCWDNAVAESFFKSIKYEMIYRYKFTSFQQLYDKVYEYIEHWYNTKRLHSSIGYMTPLQKEIQLKYNINLAA